MSVNHSFVEGSRFVDHLRGEMKLFFSCEFGFLLTLAGKQLAISRFDELAHSLKKGSWVVNDAMAIE